MSDLAQSFLAKSRRVIWDDNLSRIRKCLDVLDDADVWWRPHEQANSIGNLILHLNGNVTQWLIGGVGQLPFERHRQQEFDERNPIPRSELLERLTSTLERAMGILDGLDERALAESRTIQGYDVSVLEAVYHVTEHFSTHTGQIILLAKMRSGKDLKLWQPAERKPNP